ncbi:hypothetical protein D5018_19385 [Parashewanella curva]|uniref:Uncharacterized protein n=1 Tax=Parashewanella curva TaxID=2338552 RepID=A0A3L8PVE3_9GAMM|nr:hypothetical protein [Parashewanella curva]RLV58032.1 hypothetical protein D5018_19385 [Parashewanella curva]
MRSFGTVDISFWLTKRIKSWSDLERYFALYLLTCPHCTLIGCFYAPISYLAGDLGWDEQQVRNHLTALQKRRFLLHCDKSDWLLLRKYLKYNPIENPNQGKAALKLYLSIPKGFRYRRVLRQTLEPFIQKLPLEFQNIPQPTQASKEKSSRSSEPRPQTALIQKAACDNFETFWSQQIRKEKKAKAQEIWTQLGLNEDKKLATKVTDSWVEQKQFRQQYQDKTKTPLPHNWLSNRQWEDEYLRIDDVAIHSNHLQRKPHVSDHNLAIAQLWVSPKPQEKPVND